MAESKCRVRPELVERVQHIHLRPKALSRPRGHINLCEGSVVTASVERIVDARGKRFVPQGIGQTSTAIVSKLLLMIVKNFGKVPTELMTDVPLWLATS